MAKKKSTLQRIIESKTFECMLIKRFLSAIVGCAVGYAYHVISFAHAFGAEEKEYSDKVKWGVLFTSTIGSFLSAQCCCIAALCIPTLSARSGRMVIQATLFTWILSGPIANIFHHTSESVRSITCVVELQNNQSKLMVNLMTAPIRKGLGLIVEESESLPKSQENLGNRMNDLRVQLLSSAFGKYEAQQMMQEEEKARQRNREKDLGGKSMKKVRRKRESFDELKEEYENETMDAGPPVKVEVARNMRDETEAVCHEIFEKAHADCCKIAEKTWSACMLLIPIPLLDKIICQFVWWNKEKECKEKILDKEEEKCSERLDIEDESVDENYTDISQAVRNVKRDFKMGLYWTGPRINERSPLITIEELTKGVKDEYAWRMAIMKISITVTRKFLAVTVILVLQSSAKYNSKYLTVLTYDNFYISSYFARKDRERKRMKKRHLLPLTRLEAKHVIRPTDMVLTATESKAMLFKIVRFVTQCLFVTMLFLFDGMLYFVMDLIRRHGKSDYHVIGRHKLEAEIKGNGTVSDLMRVLFSGFLDNDHSINIMGSNEECLPKPKKLDYGTIKWTVAGFMLLAVMLFVESYLLRARRVICSTFYPRREKRRIVHLYNEMLRQRKEQIQSVRRVVLKLCLTKRLSQKYGFLQAVRLKFPKVGEILALFGIGKLRCLICETPEGQSHTLWRCSNVKCRMLYCSVCWVEVDEMCWACNSYRGVEKALPEADGNQQSKIGRNSLEEKLPLMDDEIDSNVE